MTAQFIEGEQVYACLTCLDSGWVLCWQPSALVALQEAFQGQPIPGPGWRLDPRWQAAKLGRRVYEEHALRCSCASGANRSQQVPTYNANAHCIYESAHPEKALRWLDGRRGQVA